MLLAVKNEFDNLLRINSPYVVKAYHHYENEDKGKARIVMDNLSSYVNLSTLIEGNKLTSNDIFMDNE